MAGTRSGKTNYRVGPEHQGRSARGSTSKKRETIEPRATRFQTTEAADRQKRMRITDPSPPTPTKEELVNLPRASRHSKPTCLHYGIDKRGRDILYPNHFFCQHCEDYVQAMMLSVGEMNRLVAIAKERNSSHLVVIKGNDLISGVILVEQGSNCNPRLSSMTGRWFFLAPICRLQ
jgi:hypothetical protein